MKYLSLPGEGYGLPTSQQIIKEGNLKRVFDLIRSGACASRAQLREKTGLSATTVSSLVDQLLAKELVTETGLACTRQPGRRPMGLCLNAQGRQIPVFSLTRRGVRYVLYDLNAQALERCFVEYPAEKAMDKPDAGDDYAHIFETILRTRARLFDAGRAAIIGLSFPGIFLEDEQAFSIRTAMNVSFSEASMRRIEERFGLSMFYGNVSMCRAYAEKKCLDALRPDGDEVRDMIFINVCDGVGAGIICGGDVLTGPFNTAGELGHVCVNFSGAPCACGSRGCLEEYVSMGVIERRVAAVWSGADARPTLAQAGAAFDAGEANVTRVIDEVADVLSFGVHAAMSMVGIRRIVLGGGIEQLGEGFLERLRTKIKSRGVLARYFDITYARVGADGDCLGIAQYFLDKAYGISVPGARQTLSASNG